MKQRFALLAVVVLAVAITFSLAPQTSGAFASPPPPMPIEVTVNPTGSVDSRTGTATVSGFLTCNGTFDYISLQVVVRQKQGRSVIEGTANPVSLQRCSWQNIPWSATVRSSGAYKGGAAEVLTYWSGYTSYPYYNYFNGSGAATVQLQGSRK